MLLQNVSFRFAITVTIVSDQPVLPGQAQLLLPLPHNFLHFWGEAVGVSGKHEGVAVGAGAIEVLEAAGVLHGVGVIVRVDDPVVIVSFLEEGCYAPVLHLEQARANTKE